MTTASHSTVEDIRNAIRNIPDFPKPGIQFKDITPVLADADLFRASVELLCEGFAPGEVDAVVGVDARGFIFAAAVALRLHAGFVPVRKGGKLPYNTHEEHYELEYGTSTIAIHIDAIQPGSRVLLVDDLLATGGTSGAALTLLKKMEANVLGARFLIELGFLNGRKKLDGLQIHSLIIY